MVDRRAATQRQRVLSALLEHDAVCATTFISEDYIPRVAAVVHKLRRSGYSIVTRECSRPFHRHHSRQVEYVLEALPYDPGKAADV